MDSTLKGKRKVGAPDLVDDNSSASIANKGKKSKSKKGKVTESLEGSEMISVNRRNLNIDNIDDDA